MSFLLSNVVRNAVISEDRSVLGGAVGAAILVAVNGLDGNRPDHPSDGDHGCPSVSKWSA